MQDERGLECGGPAPTMTLRGHSGNLGVLGALTSGQGRFGCGKPTDPSDGAARSRPARGVLACGYVHLSPLRVLVAGGGTAAVEAVLALRELAGERVQVELLAPGDALHPRPLSVLIPFGGDIAPAVPYAKLGIKHHRGALASVDAARRQVRTTDGDELPYDRLVVATGARAVEGVPGAVTFRGALHAGAVEGALRCAHDRVFFAVPLGVAWSLPAYELALLAAHERITDAALTIVSPEPRPLDLFGPTAADATARLLDRAGIDFINAVPAAVLEGALVLAGGRLLTADAVIALAQLEGPRIPGLPMDDAGFVPIDAHARVEGLDDVFAAGDVTAGAIKQGGVAAQQADAAAEAIAAEVGVPITPSRIGPVLRAALLTGETPLYLRVDPDGGTEVSRAPLWSPPNKLAGQYLAAWLTPGEAPGRRLADRVRLRQ